MECTRFFFSALFFIIFCVLPNFGVRLYNFCNPFASSYKASIIPISPIFLRSYNLNKRLSRKRKKMYQKSIKKVTKKIEEIHPENDQNFQKFWSKKKTKKLIWHQNKNKIETNYLINYSHIGNIWNKKRCSVF